jgi:hypothetical protein
VAAGNALEEKTTATELQQVVVSLQSADEMTGPVEDGDHAFIELRCVRRQ